MNKIIPLLIVGVFVLNGIGTVADVIMKNQRWGPYGPSEGYVGVEYTFFINLPVNPNGDKYYAKWDWGDGNITDWLGPYPSGQVTNASHTWWTIGYYNIMVKLKDTNGTESPWSDPFLIAVVESPPNSYHAFYQNNTWTVIACNFTKPTNVNFSILQRYSYNNTSDASRFIIQEISRNGEVLFGDGEFDSNGGPDRYFQIEFGPINISYYHSPPSHEAWGSSGSWGEMFNCTGCYDFLIISYGPSNTTLEINMNVSTNTTFHVTHGTEVFAFQRADFIGTMNIGWKHGTFILKGEKQITIKNSLVCLFNTQWFGGFGYEHLRYQTPSGNIAHHYAINFQYRTFLERETPTFASDLWYGEKGTWTFTVNYFMVASFGCPDLILGGADVQLPSIKS